jgi:hypothetical protein
MKTAKPGVPVAVGKIQGRGNHLAGVCVYLIDTQSKENAMSNRNVLKTNGIAIATLLFVGLALTACIVVASDGRMDFRPGRDYKENFQKSFPLGPDGRFSIRNVNGYVHVSTWDKAEVEIKAEKIAKRNEEDLQKVKIETEARTGFVGVETVYPKTSIFRNIRVEVNYEIKVPEGMTLDEVRSTNGDVTLNGRYGTVKAGTTNGDILVSGAAGRADLSTTNGDIDASGLGGPVDAHTTNGGIKLALLGKENDIRARTTNGSIFLRTGGDINARLEAHTTNGHIECDIPITIRNLTKSRRTLEGTIGSGGPLVYLGATNGSITIGR